MDPATFLLNKRQRTYLAVFITACTIPKIRVILISAKTARCMRCLELNNYASFSQIPSSNIDDSVQWAKTLKCRKNYNFSH